jgi:hypothetical protein
VHCCLRTLAKSSCGWSGLPLIGHKRLAGRDSVRKPRVPVGSSGSGPFRRGEGFFGSCAKYMLRPYETADRDCQRHAVSRESVRPGKEDDRSGPMKFMERSLGKLCQHPQGHLSPKKHPQWQARGWVTCRRICHIDLTHNRRRFCLARHQHIW